MSIGVATLHFLIPGCTSLKEKRGRIKPLLARLRREFNVSTAEIGHQDAWQEAVIAAAMVGSDANHIRSSLDRMIQYLEPHFPDLELVEHQIELIPWS